MIVVSVLYPSGAPLDLDYYRDRHLPLVRRLLAPMGMRSISYYRPGEQSPYQLVAELRFDTMAATTAALAAQGPETQADIPNFTAAVPVILIGEEVQA
jgi:uncharacterized protein (TIGR02118 family)